jgi:MFS transporter, putative metabolite:H+ symporter
MNTPHPDPPPQGGRGAQPLRVLSLAGLAAFFVSFDSAVLVLALPAIAADFHSSVPALTDLGSALAVGTLAALPISMLVDRLGRRRLLVAAVAAFSLANLASATAPTLAGLAAARVVAVCFETVASSAAVALVIEEVAPDRRGLAVAAVTVAAGAGTGLTTLLYPLLAPHWRVLYLAGASGLLAALVLALLLPESRAWAAAMGKPSPLAGGDGPSHPAPQGAGYPGPEGVSERRVAALRLLWQPPWRDRLLTLAAAGALGALFYSPAGLLVVLFGSRQLGLSPTLISATVVVAGVASTPAFLVGGRLSDRFGRRIPAVALSMLATCFAAFTFLDGDLGYWAGNVGWSVLASASVPVLGAWYGELFPTRARATSESAGALAGALGGVIGFQLVGLLQPRVGLAPALAGLAAVALAGAALLFRLPETRGEPLP